MPGFSFFRRVGIAATIRAALPRQRNRARPAAHIVTLGGTLAVLVLVGIAPARAAETIPPTPDTYVTDQAKVLPPGAVDQLNAELDAFERQTSNQIVVAIYPHMTSDSSLDDYAQRVFQAWHIGQKQKSNGALLLIFTQDHRIRIHTGYGLEGALPDITCNHIIENEIAPRFRAGDYAGGVTAGVHAMMAAARGEYRGTGRTAGDRQHQNTTGSATPIIVFVLFLLMVLTANRRSRGRSVYGRNGRTIIGPTWWGGGGWGDGGWGGGSGGFSGGGFSGGGGSSGGGGASGSW